MKSTTGYMLRALLFLAVFYQCLSLDNQSSFASEVTDVELAKLAQKYQKCLNDTYRQDCFDDFDYSEINRRAGYFYNNKLNQGYVWLNSVLTFHYINGKKFELNKCIPSEGWFHCPDGQKWKYLEGPSTINGIQYSRKRIEFANGGVFEGNYQNDLRHGYGKMMWANGDIYEGNYENGYRSGFGKMIWADGDIYEGNYENDTRHGYGKMSWVSGQIYQGEWIRGEQK